jgi:hypothetical protein
MCVILYSKNLNGKTILAKNRDRSYKPKIEIVHEIVNGVELVYFKDLGTNWMEGLNEKRCAMVNSSLYNPNRVSVRSRVRKDPDYLKHHLTKGNVFHDILCEKESIDKLLKQDRYFKMIEGHTLLVAEGKCYQIEETDKEFSIKQNHKNSVVLSNHGEDTEAGYRTGKKGVSSFLRQKIVEEELKKVKSYDQLLNIMNKNYSNIDPRFHPYRSKQLTQKYNPTLTGKHMKFVRTTSQLLLNITDLEFIYYSDVSNEKNVKFINKLPKSYTPKIKVTIHETTKSLTPTYKIFDDKYLNRVYKQFDYNPNNVVKPQTNARRKHLLTRKHHNKRIRRNSNTKSNKSKKNREKKDF